MRTTTSATAVTRYIGNYQVCEADQKLHQGRMVHHGYRRPGHGSIEGDCPGVGEVPYEVSCDLVKRYRVNVGTQLVNLENRLTKLKAGKVGYLTKMQHRSAWQPPVRWEFVAGVTEPYHWAQAVQNAIDKVNSSIRQCEREIERCTRRINAWEPKPIRTVEEEQTKVDTGRAERKAEREAARVAKNEKKAVYKAKADALAEKRVEIRKGFENQFNALAAGSEPLAERQGRARFLLAETERTKYRSWLARYELECEEAFVALGLATTDGQLNGRGRPYLRWL